MKLVADDSLPGRGGGAWLVRQDQRIRVIDVDGGAIGDFVCFNAHKLNERFSQARTKANQGKLLISKGDHLYTRDNNVLLTIVEDTYGIHDLQFGMCSAWVYRNIHKDYRTWGGKQSAGGPMGASSFGCYQVLQIALKDYPIAPENIPEPLNLFQPLEFRDDMSFSTVDGRSKPGDYVEFIAKMDTLCALSACPSMGRPLRVQVKGE